MKYVFMFIIFFSFMFSSCDYDPEENSDPCVNIDCESHGVCKSDANSEPYCECDSGFAHEVTNGEINFLSCVADPCEGIDCDLHGTCKLDATSVPYCECDAGYEHSWSDNEEMVFTCVEEQLDYKPIIYLYPEQKTDVVVQFARKEQVDLSYTYPLYSEKGWEVTAMPDGTLFDASGKEYYALYWEGFTPAYEVKTGFVVKGENTVDFLEKILPELGLTAREAQEFIIYWMPVLSESPYNFIHFSTKRWTESVPLKVVPAPDTSIRFMMLYKPLKRFVKVSPQIISAPSRKGFVLVEWGGRKYTGSLQ